MIHLFFTILIEIDRLNVISLHLNCEKSAMYTDNNVYV